MTPERARANVRRMYVWQFLTALVYPLVGWGAERSIPATFGALGAVALACALLSPLRESDLS